MYLKVALTQMFTSALVNTRYTVAKFTMKKLAKENHARDYDTMVLTGK